ncbi:hypothetical protein AMJ39_06560 [candidate division TA06 bacterium DG_24]|uniref:Thiamine-binding protein domain-containing protein n=3 Tax=Bacteria division TA06 TaxID=1156500 RepID=A0A0S8JM94_UNCT6|nr:MAG: hypothetical protein AMJ39_06560 [candidate division TA06 bacterium DG_24]KPK68611.1 MAG: hypothetical protein AMJ82_07805 [candidate division TA06 bacterium SM23_40]KPL10847.1 MAG: hypothetical protein AMJ71_01670 [candidate division TA06 bacterium SM1_40]
MVVSFSIIPLDKGVSLGKYVARVTELVEESGLDHRLTPMSTIVEGDWDEVFDLIRRCHERMREDSVRVVTTIKVDDREGATGRLDGKIQSVERHMRRSGSERGR